MPFYLGLLVAILLLSLNGFFVALEFALVAVDKEKLRQLADEGKWGAKLAVSATRRLSFHLSGAQLGITVTSLVLGLLADQIAGDLFTPLLEYLPFGSSEALSVIVALAVATAFQMIFGELIPKTLALARPEKTSLLLSPFAVLINGLFSPVIRALNGIANALLEAMGLEVREELSELSNLEELQFLIRTSGDEGAIDPESLALLNRTMKFGDKDAADALTPRVDVQAITADTSVNELIASAKSSSFSRFPVYERDLDNVIGVVDISSVFDLAPSDRATQSVADITMKPLVVPETRELVDLIEDFRESDNQMAIVIDEHGGTAGILTLEDLLEEIVGEVDDEYDDAEVLTVGVSKGVYLLAGTLHPDEVEEACGLVMPEGEYETIAGFVLTRLDRIAEQQDSVRFNNWLIEVVEVDKRRIVSLIVVDTSVSAGVENAIGASNLTKAVGQADD